MTDTDANKKVVTEFIERLFSRDDLAAVDDYLSKDFVNHDPPFGASADREGMRSAAAGFRAAFPDWHSEVHLLIAEEDLVAEVFTARGTHRGEMMGGAHRTRTVAPGDQRFPGSRRPHHRALGPPRSTSARYREIMAPLGLGDELRVAFRAGGACWGSCACTAKTVPTG